MYARHPHIQTEESPLKRLCRCAGTHTATERPYLKHFFRAKLEETLNAVREEEKLDDQPYSVVMCEEHEKEVLQFV